MIIPHQKWLRRLILAFFVIFGFDSAVIRSASLTGTASGNQIDPRAGAGFTVRLPTTVQEAFKDLGISPQRAIDYGVFQWLELSRETYRVLEASTVPFETAHEAGEIQLMTARFDPLRTGEIDLPPALRASEEGPGFHLVQLVGPTKDAWLAKLQALDLPLLQYYPQHTYLTWGPASELASLSALDFVRWQGAFHPAYKIAPDLRARSGRIQNIDLMFFNDGDVQATLDALIALGAQVRNVYLAQPDRAFFNAIVALDAEAVEAAARLNTVLWLGYQSPVPILDDEMAGQILAGNHPGGVPDPGYLAHLADLGVDGSGVRWAIVDTGVDYDHPDLSSHIAGGYSFPGACNTNPGEDCASGGHGTHVAGVVGGDASGDAGGPYADADGFLYGLGVAPNYEIFAMNSLSAPTWPPTGGWQEHSKRAVLGGAIGGTNSWTTGEGTNHGYQASERTHDILVLDGNFDTTTVAEPYIAAFGAGNSGLSGLTAPKEGKNLIVTASSRNYRVGSIETISSFSSRGPAVDGRWVPTIAAPGEQIASSRNDLGGSCSTPIAGTNNLYAYCSGTTIANAQTSGAIILAAEWWRTFHAGADPSPAMVKALLVNGAVDMADGIPIPNANEGWGRIHLTQIISPTTPTRYYDQPVTFHETGEQWTIEIQVSDPTEPLKITLAWSDAPGGVGASPALVNDLDLTVLAEGDTYRGNHFVNGWSATGGVADALNNLENVYIHYPDSRYTVTVAAANIAGDAALYNGDLTDQPFALVCYNCDPLPVYLPVAIR